MNRTLEWNHDKHVMAADGMEWDLVSCSRSQAHSPQQDKDKRRHVMVAKSDRDMPSYHIPFH